MAEYKLELRGVCKSFPGVKALDNVQLSLRPGTVHALMGENGAGKSTLFNAICGDFLTDAGSIELDGRDITFMPQHARAKEIGRLYQDPMRGTAPGMTIEENLALAAGKGGWLSRTTRQEKERFREELKKLDIGLEERMNAYPAQLSGGQKQRVAIAGVMAMRPKCIVLDEPTAMLDPNGRKEVLRSVMELRKREHITVILITHYMEEVVDADHVFVMDHGHVVMQGTPREIFSQVDTLKHYRLDVPQVTILADLLRQSGIDVPVGVLHRQELVDAILRVAQIGE